MYPPPPPPPPLPLRAYVAQPALLGTHPSHQKLSPRLTSLLTPKALPLANIPPHTKSSPLGTHPSSHQKLSPWHTSLLTPKAVPLAHIPHTTSCVSKVGEGYTYSQQTQPKLWKCTEDAILAHRHATKM